MPCSGVPPDLPAEAEHWVYRFHVGAGMARGTGRFEIHRGRTPAARLLAAVLRLPRSGSAVPVQVRVDRRPDPAVTVWTRTFDRHRMVSRQYRTDGRMIERIGPFDLVFGETIATEHIEYEQLGTRMRLLGRSVPLPASACPHVRAVARACGHDRFLVTVAVKLPRGKPLLTYSGCLDKEPSGW